MTKPLDVERSLGELNVYLKNVMDNLAPMWTIRTRRDDDYINVKIARCIKRRDRLLKKHRKFPNDNKILEKLKETDKEVRMFVKREKQRERQQMANNGDPKLF